MYVSHPQGMVFAAFGYIPPLTGAILQEVIGMSIGWDFYFFVLNFLLFCNFYRSLTHSLDVFAVMNALRTIWHPSGHNRNQSNYKYSGIVKHL
jgi:hypothetical protein